MNDIEDMINNVLSDPEQMEKLTGLAKSIMGSSEKQNPASDAPDISSVLSSLGQNGSTDSGIDPAVIGTIGKLMNFGAKSKPHEQALLEAMKPYLSEKRRGKMDRAIKLAKLARIARLALGEFGGGDGN